MACLRKASWRASRPGTFRHLVRSTVSKYRIQRLLASLPRACASRISAIVPSTLSSAMEYWPFFRFAVSNGPGSPLRPASRACGICRSCPTMVEVEGRPVEVHKPVVLHLIRDMAPRQRFEPLAGQGGLCAYMSLRTSRHPVHRPVAPERAHARLESPDRLRIGHRSCCRTHRPHRPENLLSPIGPPPYINVFFLVFKTF